jgi:Ni,Fe-hydrogenase maturation factor
VAAAEPVQSEVMVIKIEEGEQSEVMEDLVYYQQLLVTIMLVEVEDRHIQVVRRELAEQVEEEQELAEEHILME